MLRSAYPAMASTAERILKDRASSYEPRFKKRGGKIGNSKMNGNKFVASFYDK